MLKLYPNCASIEVTVEIQFCQRIVIKRPVDICDNPLKISCREVLNFRISGSVRRKKALEMGKCSVV